MRIFKTAAFSRFSKKNKIADKKLVKAINDAEKGLIEADLGGGVIKQRLPRDNEGKSGGYRSIIYYRKGNRAFFVHGYAKKDKADITSEEKKAFKESAKIVLNFSDEEIKKQIKDNQIQEINGD